MATIEWTEPDDPSGRELDDLRAAPVVTLEWHEAAMAARVGLSRQLNALAAGKPEADGRGDEVLQGVAGAIDPKAACAAARMASGSTSPATPTTRLAPVYWRCRPSGCRSI